jgi:hypothetical protein
MDEPCLFDASPASLESPDAASEVWTATEYARGPWDPRHCHGGPVSALLARACERAPSGDVDWLITRLTIELTRPVPVGVPLALSTVVERPGRKVSVVVASLSNGGVDVAKVRALRVRRELFSLPEHPLIDVEIEGAPGSGRREEVSWATDGATIAFHSHSAEHRIVEGGWDDPGPIKLWIRMTVPLVEGEQPTGVQRVAAAADFGNGVSSGIDYARYLYINPDLTIHLARRPEGDWVGMSSHSVYGTATESSGAGFAESALHDEFGRLGRSVQSLFVAPR